LITSVPPLLVCQRDSAAGIPGSLLRRLGPFFPPCSLHSSARLTTFSMYAASKICFAAGGKRCPLLRPPLFPSEGRLCADYVGGPPVLNKDLHLTQGVRPLRSRLFLATSFFSGEFSNVSPSFSAFSGRTRHSLRLFKWRVLCCLISFRTCSFPHNSATPLAEDRPASILSAHRFVHQQVEFCSSIARFFFVFFFSLVEVARPPVFHDPGLADACLTTDLTFYALALSGRLS